jgi:hypothetical protein
MKKIMLPRPSIRFILAAFCTVALLLLLPATRAGAQYKGDEKHVVSLEEATRYVKNFRSNPLAPATKGGYFGRNIFEKILAQPGTVGIRYYYAANDDGSPTIVLVGVDSTGDDMVKGVVAEHGLPCPPFCPTVNSLGK